MIVDLIRERGPVTVAAFMNLALYDREVGYYARAPRRSGCSGDFFTSVDVGPIFGELLARQMAEMAEYVHPAGALPATHGSSATAERASTIDLIEAGASDGRLAADVLRSARRLNPTFYERIRLHLVEVSAAARDVQTATLGDVAERLASTSDTLPARFEGILFANELLDAFPVHQVVMTGAGLREIYVAADPAGLRLVEGPLSSPALADYFTRLGIELRPGWRAEVNLRAVEFVEQAAARLRRGFLLLIDYGHEARDLYSAVRASGTLTSFARHQVFGDGSPAATPGWLEQPGERDLTSHVDFTSVRMAAEAAGLTTIAFLDQTYFLLGLLNAYGPPSSWAHLGERDALRLKTLLMPGGLGSTHKVLILGAGVGTPALAGCSFRVRVT